MTLDEIEALAKSALVGAGASERQAASVARSTRRAEADGIRSHGLMYVPIYAEHVSVRKSQWATPNPSVDATAAGNDHGRRGPRLRAPGDRCGMGRVHRGGALANGVAAMTVRNSYNCGVLGHHAERLGGGGPRRPVLHPRARLHCRPRAVRRPVVGTNPFALAVPGAEGRSWPSSSTSPPPPSPSPRSSCARSPARRSRRAGRWTRKASRPRTPPQPH